MSIYDRIIRIPTLRDLDARCTRPPKGWYCNLDDGHDGPCPARPLSRRVRKRLAWICPCRGCRKRDKHDARIARALARRRGNDC